MPRTPTKSLGILALTLASLAGCAMAQPPAPGQPEPPTQGPGPGAGPEMGDLRARLERRMKENEEVHQKLQEALARLDKGEPPIEVLRSLGPLGGRQGPGPEDAPMRREGMPGRAPVGGPDRGPGPGPGGPDGAPGRGMGGPGRMEGGPGGPGMGEGPDRGPGGPDRMDRGPERGVRRPGAEGPGMGPGRERAGARPGAAPEGEAGMPPEERRRVMEFVRVNMPELAERFKAWREVDPEGADRMVGRLLPRIHEALETKKHDPELFKLRIEELRGGVKVMEQARELREARTMSPGPERDAKIAEVEKRVRGALEAQFDTRAALQAHEIKSLEKRVAELREEAKKSGDNREKVIDRMLTRMREGPERGDRREGPDDDRDEKAPKGE